MDSLKVMILGVNQYEFTDEKTKREVKGTTVHYVQLVQANEDNKVGLFPTKATISHEEFYQFKGLVFPMLAEASIMLDLTSKNPIKIKGFLLGEHVLLD